MFFFRRKKRAHRILLMTNGLILIAGAMLAPIYALFVNDIGGDLFDASLVAAVFAVAAGVTTLVSGQLTDAAKEKEYIVIFGYVIMGFGFLSLVFVESVLTLFLVQILLGFGEAIYAPAFDALYSRSAAKKHAGRSWGAWEALAYFSAAVGAIIGGWIAVELGFDALFVTMALVTLGSALYIYRLPRKVL